MSDWTLTYWIHGLPPDSCSAINVPQEMTVDGLKDHVIQREKLSLTRLSLHVYQVPDDKPVPDDDSMKDILGSLSFSALGKPLEPTRTLASYFKAPILQHLHLVIDTERLIIRCWYREDSRGSSFVVRASASEQVDSLKSAIKTEQQTTLADVPVHSLKLYKISTRDTDISMTLGTIGMGQLLDGGQFLGEVFNDVPFSCSPRVVIEWLDEGLGHKRKAVDHEVVDLVALAKRTKLATESPSVVSNPSYYIGSCCEDQVDQVIDHRPPHLPFYSGRHYPDDLPSISLQYKGFGYFLDVFSGRKDIPGMEHVLSDRLKWAVDDFANLMSRSFIDNATKRVAGLRALNKIFSKYTRTDKLSWQFTAAVVDKNFVSHGHILGPHHAASCVVEFKNEQSDVTTIPYVQMTSYFAHSIRAALEHDVSVKVMQDWNIPCLGLTIIGPSVTFYALIYYGRWRVLSITPGLSCILESGQGADRSLLYAAFKAASVFLAYITNDATTLVCNPPPAIRGSRDVPYISSLSDPHSDNPIQFNIHARIFHDKTTDRELYLAKTTDNKIIAVKFSRRYSPELHAFCASRGGAPTLLGFEKLPGGFFGIAMEYIRDACSLTKSPYVEMHKEWVTRLRELVQSFHDENLVHGDLRSPNIVCDGTRVMIIDFDWAGKFEEAYYPDIPLNPELTNGRVSSDRKITKDDDLRVLNMTLEHVR